MHHLVTQTQGCDVFTPVNRHAHSFMFISVLSKSTPVVPTPPHLLTISDSTAPPTHLKPSSCTTVINQNKTRRFAHLFVVFKLLSLCFSQLMFTLALQGAHYRCHFIHGGAEVQRSVLLVQRHMIVIDGASFLFTSNVLSSLTGRYTYCRKVTKCKNGISKEMKLSEIPPT